MSEQNGGPETDMERAERLAETLDAAGIPSEVVTRNVGYSQYSHLRAAIRKGSMSPVKLRRLEELHAKHQRGEPIPFMPQENPLQKVVDALARFRAGVNECRSAVAQLAHAGLVGAAVAERLEPSLLELELLAEMETEHDTDEQEELL